MKIREYIDLKLKGVYLRNFSDALTIDHRFAEAKKQLLHLKEISQYKWEIIDYCNLARAYNKENKRDSVLYYIDRAKEVGSSS